MSSVLTTYTETNEVCFATDAGKDGPNPFDEEQYPTLPGPSLPKRYEEFKICRTQDASHQKIIAIGGEIDDIMRDKKDAEIADAVEKTEKAIWHRARSLEDRSIAEMRKEALKDQQKIIAKLKTENDRVLKEALLKVESRLLEQEKERMRLERQEAHKRLREAVREKEEDCEKKLAHVVAETRKQEQQLATVELAKVERENKEKLEKVIQDKEEERAVAVQNMVTKMLAERDKAIEESKAEEAKKLKIAMDNSKKAQEFERRKVDLIMIEHAARIEAMEEDMNHSKICQTNLQNKLISLHHSFHDYVDATSKNVKGHNAFLVPPLHNIGYNLHAEL